MKITLEVLFRCIQRERDHGMGNQIEIRNPNYKKVRKDILLSEKVDFRALYIKIEKDKKNTIIKDQFINKTS